MFLGPKRPLDGVPVNSIFSMIRFSRFPIKRWVSLLLTALLLLTGCQIQVGYTDSDTDSVTSSHTAPPTTEAPSATVVTTTKAPATTTAPQATEPAKEGGCGGFTAAAQIIAVLCSSVAFIVIKKRK